jgi:hypothetical protein
METTEQTNANETIDGIRELIAQRRILIGHHRATINAHVRSLRQRAFEIQDRPQVGGFDISMLENDVHEIRKQHDEIEAVEREIRACEQALSLVTRTVAGSVTNAEAK